MSSERVSEFIHKLILSDESLTDANNCRNSVTTLKKNIEGSLRGARVQYLAFPEAREGDGVHYSVLVDCDGVFTLVNLVSAPGFPVYVGDVNLATPLFSVMQRVDEVI